MKSPKQTPIRKADANRIAEAQIAAWLERNRDPVVLPSIPVILISSLTGDKPGITLNLSVNMPLADVVAILKAAAQQVENTIKRMEENGGQTALQ